MTTEKKTVAKKTVAKKTTTAKKAPVSVEDKALDDIARETLTNKWGTGRDRDTALRDAGHDPTAVQAARARLQAENTNPS